MMGKKKQHSFCSHTISSMKLLGTTFQFHSNAPGNGVGIQPHNLASTGCSGLPLTPPLTPPQSHKFIV